VTAPSGQFFAVLDWKREGDGSEYQIGLYDPSTESVFRLSTERFQTQDNNRQVISTQITQRPVDIIIIHTNGPANDRLELQTYPRRLEDATGNSSILPPADAPASIGVAAYVRADKRTARYSSKGPTDDNRIAPTVTGYTNVDISDRTFTGTSAAAPHVAGVAALVESATVEDQSPGELRATLEITADDINVSGRDTVSGAGVVNASAALETGGNIEPVTESADFKIKFVYTPTELVQGEPDTVKMNVTNKGSSSATQAIEYTLENETDPPAEIKANKEIIIEPDVSKNVTFDITDAEADTIEIGNYTHMATSDNDETTVSVEIVPDNNSTNSPLRDTAGEYDANNDGTITASELGSAVTDFGEGKLTASELGEVVTAFGQS
jgi:subtilisin family serine protease